MQFEMYGERDLGLRVDACGVFRENEGGNWNGKWGRFPGRYFM